MACSDFCCNASEWVPEIDNDVGVNIKDQFLICVTIGSDEILIHHSCHCCAMIQIPYLCRSPREYKRQRSQQFVHKPEYVSVLITETL